jgi:EAL domain-containing protein (putative c-di-GMP-specific phosphodiesterase class I)/PAS domain-containing protein
MINSIKSYITASAALLLATLLLFIDLFFEDTTGYWAAILWIGLLSVILIMLGQLVHAARQIKNYSEQLSASKERLNNEIKHRLWAEKTTAESKVKSQYVDENIPVMLAYFNAEQRCRYHNRLFRKWFGLTPDRIDGLLLSEFANKEFTSSISKHIDAIFSGKTVHEERVLKSAKGFPYIFIEQYIPYLDNKGRIVGFYTLHTPRAQEKHLVVSRKNQQPQNILSVSKNSLLSGADPRDAITASRIAQAIDGGKFNVYCQKMVPVDKNALLPVQYEILIRMLEEENNLMPPGSFLPLVDQFGLMPQLDCWVAGYVIKWIAENCKETRSVFCLNIARDTLRDKKFITFINDKLQENQLSVDKLCFEIEESDAHSNLEDAILFTEAIRKIGCLVTLCSFGQSPASMDLLNKVKFDYLKIDGSIICNMLHDDENMKRIKGINQIARRLSIKTIAELVETRETLAKLNEIGINYAQGFGIAKPCPLDSIDVAMMNSKTGPASAVEKEECRVNA